MFGGDEKQMCQGEPGGSKWGGWFVMTPLGKKSSE